MNVLPTWYTAVGLNNVPFLVALSGPQSRTGTYPLYFLPNYLYNFLTCDFHREAQRRNSYNL